MTNSEGPTEGQVDPVRATSYLELIDYRRKVAQMYAQVRASDDPESGWEEFVRDRDRLFKNHPQSALTTPQREEFTGLEYFPYDPELRILAPVEPDQGGGEFHVTLEQDGETRLRRAGWIEIHTAGGSGRLALYWLEGYGGGLFLPFRDRTNGEQTYAGGRYLLDTIKGADLGTSNGHLVVDFNFAYNPSCAYDPRWHCPLPPSENWLDFPIRAGEKKFSEQTGAGPRQDAYPRPAAD